MAIVAKAAVKFSKGTYSIPFIAVMPARVRLAIDLGKMSAASKGLFSSIGSIAEFDVQGLLALAPLRHGGAPYTDDVAIAKETLLWMGWLDVHTSGSLVGRLLVGPGSNSGRQTEFSGGLAECLAVAIMTDVLKLPLATIQRIPESGPEGMDFRTAGPNATAIESKAGYGSCVKQKKRLIAQQMKRQKFATQKYGLILCYQKSGGTSLIKKGSYLHVYDPPAVQVSEDETRALLVHYLQIAQTIGFWSLVDGLRAALGMPPRPSIPTKLERDRHVIGLAEFVLDGVPNGDQRQRSLVKLSRYGPGICFEVKGHAYLARAFRYERLLGLAEIKDPFPRPITVLGLSFAAAQALARYLVAPDAAALRESLLANSLKNAQDFRIDAEDEFGPRYYRGLEDGVVRVDLVSLSSLLDTSLNVQV